MYATLDVERRYFLSSELQNQQAKDCSYLLLFSLGTAFLRTPAQDFPNIKNNLSLVSVKLRTKTRFLENKAVFA